MPDHLAGYVSTWREHHPGWEHRLWTDESMPALRNQDLYDRTEQIAPRNVGQFRADIARYELLHAHGGVYVDVDMECLRPIDPLLDRVTAFACWEREGRWVNNAILGATPGHPFLEALIAGLPANVAAHPGGRPNVLTGPQYLTPVWRRHRRTVVVFPKRFFYPYLFNELHRQGEDFPDSYGVHHWHNRRTNERTAP